MASPSKIHLTVENTGAVGNKPQDKETAAKTSQLLQENHDKYHSYFNIHGFHNHITHHLLTLYGLGAPYSVIQEHYNANTSYQRPTKPASQEIVEHMSDPSQFKKYLQKEKHYNDFLAFFQKEMEKKSWQDVLNEYVFAGDERADDMFGRMFAGFFHPIIHLGFGIEFNQPAIIAEALAQAATHDTWTTDFLVAIENAASLNSTTASKTMPEILDAIRADTKLSSAAAWADNNKIRDGIMVRAPKEMISHSLHWAPTIENLKQKTVEMINSAIYFTACAQAPPKQVKFDFYYMHCVNASIFFPVFNEQSWLSTENKVRLLKYKGWLDLAMYASRRSPKLLLEEVSTYVPAKLEARDTEWGGIFRRLWELSDDDGHAIKLGRAVRNGELVTQEWVKGAGNDEEFRIKDFMWEKIGNMVIDSVEDSGSHWVRSAGFEEAWKDYGDRPPRTQL